MENYVLYDEVGRGEHSIVYKGRKKGSVEFLAIHCVDKCKRLELQNIVRLTHELQHENIVLFHEWYETTNHIWMVVELCTGSTLADILSQDTGLPEATVKHFGAEIAKALFYIHTLGIVYCDLKPSKVLLDGPGNVKLSDFALARVEGEEDFLEYGDANDIDPDGNGEGMNHEKVKRPKTSPYYMAPEVLMGSPHSMQSDLWAFGCLLFELFTGDLPFVAETFEELAEKILGHDFPEMKQSNETVLVGATPEFSNLIQGLLEKDPPKRISWGVVAKHPFWDGMLSDLFDGTTGEEADLSEHEPDVLVLSEDKEVTSKIGHAPVKRTKSKELAAKSEGIEKQVEDKIPSHAPVKRTKSKELAEKSQANITKKTTQVSNYSSKGSYQRSIKTANSQSISDSHASLPSTAGEQARQEVSELIFHPSDFIVSPIIDNPKIKKIPLPKYDPKALPCPPLKPAEIMELPEEKILEHLSSIETLLLQSERSGGHVAALQRSKLHTVGYLASLCRSAELANMLFESEMIPHLVGLVKTGFSADFKAKIGYLLGILAGNATLISEDFYMTEVFTTLTEVIRDNFRNTRLKQHLLPALGEFLFYAATQEEIENRQIAKWDAPGLTFTIITRCLNDGEDIDVQHFAAKTIELVSTTHGRHASKLVTNDIAQLLWKLFTHCTVDVQKVTALSALCRLTCHSTMVFQHVVEKAGFKAVIGALTTTIPGVQQALASMFAALLASRQTLAKRLIKEKDFINKVIHLLDSPSNVIRGKTFLVVLGMVQLSKEALLGCCQSKLITHIEKDQRRAMPIKGESAENLGYLRECLQYCITAITKAAPEVLTNVVGILDEVRGRKHPSANQAKDLRTHLPLLSIILHLVTTHLFRAQVINKDFLNLVGRLLNHVQSIDAGGTSIGSAAGPNAAEDLAYVVLSIMESITQHPPLLLEHHVVIVDDILPPLASLVSSTNGNTRMLCLRMFSDVSSIYLDNSNVCSSSSDNGSVLTSTHKLNEVIRQHLLPQYHLILQDQDPLPSYAIKLLTPFIERSPDIISTFIEQGLLQNLSQIITSHAGEGNLVLLQGIIGLLDCILCSKNLDMRALYQQGLIDSVTSLFVDVVAIVNGNTECSSEELSAILLPLIDTVNNILKFVSKEVRLALQAKAEADANSAEMTCEAEVLLLDTKPISDLTGLLINLLCFTDPDVQEWSCKSLYLVAELFGGACEDVMSTANISCLAEALECSDDKRCKQLLRIIKRMVSSNLNHVESVVTNGRVLIDTLSRLSTNDVETIRVLAQDVLGKIGVNSA
ncbi:predicted protein [Nematostella vectensis]|uniref:Protein kinase domain-containing protein n=1 Tax=Nematostella vectensis TaxID=45351 RepID=A7SQU3_NEMVE|nr:predicted protein [Nematostella vectensis]|eukprot:XP_001625999.1 predicted protein [Nematostella vectensis]